jgi:hypothetical protein
MAKSADFQAVFEALKRILQKYEPKLILAVDKPDGYGLNTPPSALFKNKEGFFASVQVRKGYVSYYLMPVYAFPDLLKGISPELKKRMQGKSCFNFTQADKALLKELAGLTRQGFDRFKREKVI